MLLDFVHIVYYHVPCVSCQFHFSGKGKQGGITRLRDSIRGTIRRIGADLAFDDTSRSPVLTPQRADRALLLPVIQDAAITQ